MGIEAIYREVQKTPKSCGVMYDVFSFYVLFWDERTFIFQLSGFYCSSPHVPMLWSHIPEMAAVSSTAKYRL